MIIKRIRIQKSIGEHSQSSYSPVESVKFQEFWVKILQDELGAPRLDLDSFQFYRATKLLWGLENHLGPLENASLEVVGRI